MSWEIYAHPSHVSEDEQQLEIQSRLKSDPPQLEKDKFNKKR